jgi:hypothetical protein
MEPFHVHLQMELAVRAFLSLMVTTGDPGDHGVVVTGMHGCGVSTPCAAAVAAVTCGFASERHKPKGAMFTIATKSITVAMGLSSPVAGAVGSTVSNDCEFPWLHVSDALLATSLLMVWCSSWRKFLRDFPTRTVRSTSGKHESVVCLDQVQRSTHHRVSSMRL